MNSERSVYCAQLEYKSYITLQGIYLSVKKKHRDMIKPNCCEEIFHNLKKNERTPRKGKKIQIFR